MSGAKLPPIVARLCSTDHGGRRGARSSTRDACCQRAHRRVRPAYRRRDGGAHSRSQRSPTSDYAGRGKFPTGAGSGKGVPRWGRKGDLMATTQAPAPHTGRTRAPYRETPSPEVPASHAPPTSAPAPSNPAPAPSGAGAQPDARPSGKSRRLLFLIPILLRGGSSGAHLWLPLLVRVDILCCHRQRLANGRPHSGRLTQSRRIVATRVDVGDPRDTWSGDRGRSHALSK